MKVLWFSGTMPADFAQAIGAKAPVLQGWIPALIRAVRKFAPQLELTVACVGPQGAQAEVAGVSYRALERAEAAVVGACVRAVRPDLIHLHGSENVYPALPREVWNGVPVCMSLQGIINGLYPHATGNLLPGEIRPYLGLVRSLGLGSGINAQADRWRVERAARERSAFGNIRHILGRTAWDRAWTSYLSPEASYHVVGELLRDPFYQAHRGADTVKHHWIYCGAALGSPLKGGHWLIRAVAALKRKYPDVRLRIAGGAGCQRLASFYGRLRQPQYARYIWHLIEDLHLGDCVDLLPALTASEVAEELAQAEVFCLPSLGENSPNSLGEAMLMGVPSVVTDVGGCTSLLQPEAQGLVVPSGDPAVLAAAIDRVFADAELAARLGAQGQAYARERYAPATVVGQLLQAYSDVLKLERK